MFLKVPAKYDRYVGVLQSLVSVSDIPDYIRIESSSDV
jgi:hypothetical protein